jgi:hypothetical protein
MSNQSELALGRLDVSLVNGTKAVVFDNPTTATKAIITKLDQILAWQAAVGAAIATATDGSSLYTALNTAAVKTALAQLRFTL